MIDYDNEDGFYGEFIFGEHGWTPPGYEDELWKYCRENCDYAISTHGRVWSCKSNMFLQPGKADRYGHLQINMCYNGMRTNVPVHRMVAEMFIPNPYNLPVVRHLDGDPANNAVWNLAWGTQRDNYEDSVRHGTARPPKQPMPIIAISESDETQIWFPSQIEAARELHLKHSHICRCLNGQLSHTGGYSFVRAQGGEANADCPQRLH